MAQPTFVRAWGNSSKAGVISLATTCPATLPVGDLIVVIAGYGNTAATSFTTNMASDSSGGSNAWARADQRAWNNGNGVAGIAWCVLTTQLTTSHTITVTAASSTGNFGITFLQFSTVAASPLDGTVGSAAPASTATVNSGATSSPTQADEVFVGAVVTNAPNTDTVNTPTDGNSNALTLPTNGKNGTTGGGTTTNVTAFGHYLLTSTSQTRSMLGTLSTGRVHYSVGVNFKGTVTATDYPATPSVPRFVVSPLIRM